MIVCRSRALRSDMFIASIVFIESIVLMSIAARSQHQQKMLWTGMFRFAPKRILALRPSACQTAAHVSANVASHIGRNFDLDHSDRMGKYFSRVTCGAFTFLVGYGASQSIQAIRNRSAHSTVSNRSALPEPANL